MALLFAITTVVLMVLSFNLGRVVQYFLNSKHIDKISETIATEMIKVVKLSELKLEDRDKLLDSFRKGLEKIKDVK